MYVGTSDPFNRGLWYVNKGTVGVFTTVLVPRCVTEYASGDVGHG